MKKNLITTDKETKVMIKKMKVMLVGRQPQLWKVMALR